MNQNRNTPYYVGNHWFANDWQQKQNSGMSIFNLEQTNEAILEQDRNQRKSSFNCFIDSRNTYLSRLHTLGDNWISGSSKQPTEKSINLSKDIINDLGNWYTNDGYKHYVYPKVIMSPTPAGGIAMEIEMFPEIRAYISILNDAIHFEVETDGFFAEKEVDRENLSNQLLTLYSSYEGGHYSKR